jgi:hypothetical protein
MNDPLQRASVTLLINDDDLVPEELTALLGREPDTGVRKAESFVAHHGRLVTARTGMWHLGTGYREPPDIDQQISELLGSLPDSLAIWSDLTTRFECCYITVGVYFADHSWTGGIFLKPQTLLMLGQRGLAIDFDMYAPGASN